MRQWLILCWLIVDCVTAPRTSYLVDRIEHDRAVLIDQSGRSISVAIGDLPPHVAEGDFLVNGRLSPDEREKWTKRIIRQRNGLAADHDAGNDFSLE